VGRARLEEPELEKREASLQVRRLMTLWKYIIGRNKRKDQKLNEYLGGCGEDW
jgi:hypothetical protein